MNGYIDKWIGYGVVLFKHYAINGLSTHNQERFFSDCFYAYYFFSLVKHRTKMILVFTGKAEISYLCKNGIISNIYGPFTVNDESKSAGIIS